MSSYGSWSVKGIDDRARAVAKEKARLEGVTLGDYINGILLQGHSEAGPRDMPSLPDMRQNPTTSLDGLTRRIEAVEARSTLAITGIDQSVLGLLARLEGTEHASSAMAAEVESMIDELRETHETLQLKVEQIETDDTGHQNLQAMKALEQALGKLATHVYEENNLSQDETSAIKGRMESGFGGLSDRVEGMEVKVETTLADAAQRVEKAVEQSELRAEGTSRHLSERFSAIEASVATKLAKVEDVNTRMKAVEGDVSGAITSMEGTLVRIQERLNRAENTTDTALKALEQTFASLDDRIDAVAIHSNPERAEALRKELETRFDDLARDLRTRIEQSRTELANEIEQAATGENPELMGRLGSTMDALSDRLDASDDREARLVDQVGAQMDSLSDQLNQRVVESENRSAAAIEQVGEQVAGAIRRVQARQDATADTIQESLATAAQAQDVRLSKALENMSERLSDMQSQTVSFVSPVQKAMASLAARLEAVEDFNLPPHIEEAARPEIEAIADIDLSLSQPEEELSVAETALEPDQVAPAANDDDFAFVAGLQALTDDITDADTQADQEDWAADTETVDEDYRAAQIDTPDLSVEHVTDNSVEDFLDELGSTDAWNDGRDEARDSDIFADEYSDDFDLTTESSEMHEDEADANIPFQDLEPSVPEDEPADYLARARRAAITAAKEGVQPPLKDRRASASAGRRDASLGLRKSNKIPAIAAVTALIVASAASAGTYLVLRGKQDAPSGAINMATLTGDTPDTVAAVPPPTLEGVTYDETQAALTTELFDEEGSTSPNAQPLAAITELETPIVERLELPVVPIRLTLERAAVEGDPVAQFKWGEARLAASDYAAGSDYVVRAAQQGLATAQYRLGKLHEQGLGVPRDLVEARAWTQKAAQGGNIKAMHDLAVFYADGEAGPQSYAAAAEWFKKAADTGLVDSQYNLAVLYENGLGISPSKTEALYWYEIAARNGDASAPGNVTQLRDLLTLEQAQAAQRRATTWTPTTPLPAANGDFGPQAWENGTREQVATIQVVLNGLGYSAGTPDGIPGAGTRTAIRSFQADAGLPTDGQISDELVEHLNTQAQAA